MPREDTDLIFVHETTRNAIVGTKNLLTWMGQNPAKSRVLLAVTRDPLHADSILAQIAGVRLDRVELVAILHASNLRKVSANKHDLPMLSTVSPERAAADLARELAGHGALVRTFRPLSYCLVVLSPSALAICKNMGQSKDDQKTRWDVSIVYHDQDLYSPTDDAGDKVGHTLLIAISIAENLAAGRGPSEAPANKLNELLVEGAKLGVHRCRWYREQGVPEVPQGLTGNAVAEYWCRDLVRDRRLEPDQRARIHEIQIETDANWNLFRTCCLNARLHNETEPLTRAAQTIVLKGVQRSQQVYGFPVAHFGKWTGVDRDEVEGYQTLVRLMRKYVSSLGWGRPLSLAAFGPPGSGKSFGIKQVASNLPVKELEFNLGQFTVASDLANALFKVRDAALGGMVPLVMFDEFDATFEGRPHGWLKYLLAPTQDGKFRGGDSDFNIGRAIFVFVGGVSHTFDDLVGQMRGRAFIEAKGPDFVSRLRGHVNVRGPDKLGDKDDFHLIRRAVLLRSCLERQFDAKPDQEIDIDPGVLAAFLKTREYRHGVRSIEAIVDMSNFSDPRNQFTKSSLPPIDQLDMHTDALEFLQIVLEERGESDSPRA